MSLGLKPITWLHRPCASLHPTVPTNLPAAVGWSFHHMPDSEAAAMSKTKSKCQPPGRVAQGWERGAGIRPAMWQLWFYRKVTAEKGYGK